MPGVRDAIRDFLAAGPYAVVGASNDRAKFGNRVLRHVRAAGRVVYAVNPGAEEVEGEPCYPELAACPEPVPHVSIVTPPAVTEVVVVQAAEAGARIVWMQPGAESPAAVAAAEARGLRVVAGGPCVLVELR